MPPHHRDEELACHASAMSPFMHHAWKPRPAGFHMREEIVPDRHGINRLPRRYRIATGIGVEMN